MKFPCENCITLAICLSSITSNEKMAGTVLSMRCTLFKKYWHSPCKKGEIESYLLLFGKWNPNTRTRELNYYKKHPECL